MEQTFNIKACCALCEYFWDENNCPLFKTLSVALERGIDDFSQDMRYRMICNEFEINSKFKLTE